jgi:quinol monooxygenase YgiN
MAAPHPVIELRQYKIVAGKRDALIDLFERHFVDSQEALGNRLVGQFRDLDDPNRFTWIRAFEDMDHRGKALTDFYFGPVWQAHRAEANPLLDDNDNVLLLRPAQAGSGFGPPRGARAE